MLRTEMIDNLLESYTKRELKALATRLGVDVKSRVFLFDPISDILFDPAGSYHEFNKLAEASDG